MGIGSMLNAAANAVGNAVQDTANEATAAAAEVKGKVEQPAPKPVLPHVTADSFERARELGGTRSLYQPGTGAPGRSTKELGGTLGQRLDASASSFEQHAVAGLAGRVFAETSRAGAAVGARAFAGVQNANVATAANGDSHLESTKLGAEVKAAVYGGAQYGAQLGAMVGADLREKDTTRRTLANGSTLKEERGWSTFEGAKANLGAQVGAVTGGEAEAFVGLSQGGEAREALVRNGYELAGVGVGGEVMMGFGVKAEGEFGYDEETAQLRLKVGGGVAVGVGAAGSVELTAFGLDTNEKPERE